MSRHIVPIYFANLTIQKFKINANKSITKTEKITFEKLVIKGFHINYMKNQLIGLLQKKFNIKENFEIVDIDLIVQLGYGVNDLQILDKKNMTS